MANQGQPAPLIDCVGQEGYDHNSRGAALLAVSRCTDPPLHRPPSMRLRRFQQRTLRGLRGGLAAAAAMALLLATVGAPMPVGPPKDRSIPFPCMDRACGCQDAAGCKEHCCCFSSDEKVAWAAERGVDPTPFVESRTLARLAAGHRHQPEPPACCSKKAAERPAPNSPSESLSIAAYRQCKGLASLWSLLGAALPSTPPMGYEFEWILTGRVARGNHTAASVLLSPPTPPPRV